MYNVKELSKKNGFTWLVISEFMFLMFSIYMAFNGEYETSILLLILVEIRSYIFAQSK